MKAWFVWVDDECGDYVHGETPGKAKSKMCRTCFTGTDFTDLRPMRIPELDDKPLTTETISAIRDEDNPWDEPIICRCELCKGAKA